MPISPVAAATAVGPAPSVDGLAGRSFGAVLEARAARPPLAPQGPSRAPGAALEAFRSVERAQRRLDAVLEAARRGRTFTAQELLSLQAEAYRCAQTLDLAARAVEHGAQGVKQAVNTQV